MEEPHIFNMRILTLSWPWALFGSKFWGCLRRLRMLTKNNRNNIEEHYGMHLFANWMRQNHKKFLKSFLEKGGCQAEITTDVSFLGLMESSRD